MTTSEAPDTGSTTLAMSNEKPNSEATTTTTPNNNSSNNSINNVSNDNYKKKLSTSSQRLQSSMMAFVKRIRARAGNSSFVANNVGNEAADHKDGIMMAAGENETTVPEAVANSGPQTAAVTVPPPTANNDTQSKVGCFRTDRVVARTQWTSRNLQVISEVLSFPFNLTPCPALPLLVNNIFKDYFLFVMVLYLEYLN